MKRNILFILCALVGLNAFAQMAGSTSKSYKIITENPITSTYETGYKGFVEIGGGIGNRYTIGAYTTHGYQFSSFLFTGIGIGVEGAISDSDIRKVFIPIFGELRLNMRNPNTHKNTPFIGTRIGYNMVTDGERGVYFNLFTGYRIPLTYLLAFNFNVGYQLHGGDSELRHLAFVHIGIEF